MTRLSLKVLLRCFAELTAFWELFCPMEMQIGKNWLCEEIDSEDPMSAYEDAGNEIGCIMEPSTTIGGYPIWIQGES